MLKILIWIAGATVLAAVYLQPALAQVSQDEIHILPPPSMLGRQAERQSMLKSNVDLVLVNVTVTDSKDRLVNNLRARDCRVLDDKHRQQIRYFSSEDVPISVGVILDASGSMKNKMEQVCRVVMDFFRYSNPQDEFAVVTVADTPRLLADFTGSLADIEPVLNSVLAGGETALWDAVYFGLEQMRRARHTKKALLLISDGGDNYSRFTQREIKSVLMEADVQVYAIDLFEPHPRRWEEASGLLSLDEVASTTGGRVFLTHDSNEMHRAVRQISEELRNQYVLGYLPGPPARDGRWHRIKVGLNVAKPREFRTYAKQGYYGPVDHD